MKKIYSLPCCMVCYCMDASKNKLYRVYLIPTLEKILRIIYYKGRFEQINDYFSKINVLFPYELYL